MKKLLITTLKFIAFFMGWALLGGLLPVPNTDNPAIWRFGAELIPLLVVVGFTILFWMIEKRKIQLHILSKPISNVVVGMIAGPIWLGAVVLILSTTGIMHISSSSPVSLIWLWLLSAFLNTIMQEMLIRGYLYQLLKSNYNIATAVIITTVLFTVLHGGAFEAGIIPVLNVLTTSLLLTTVMEYTESLIAPIIMHSIWNGVGAIILGCVSLADDYPNLYTSIFNGNELLSGGICGIEGSIVTLIVNVVLISAFIFLKVKKEKNTKENYEQARTF